MKQLMSVQNLNNQHESLPAELKIESACEGWAEKVIYIISSWVIYRVSKNKDIFSDIKGKQEQHHKKQIMGRNGIFSDTLH